MSFMLYQVSLCVLNSLGVLGFLEYVKGPSYCFSSPDSFLMHHDQFKFAVFAEASEPNKYHFFQTLHLSPYPELTLPIALKIQ